MFIVKSLASPFTDDVLDVVCKNRGVDKGKILNYSVADTIHYSKLNNIIKAVKLLKSIIENGSVKIGILVDSDPDGYTSAAILVQYIEKNFPHVEIILFFHEGKQHGLDNDGAMNQIIAKAEELDLLIVPDAGSNDIKQHERLDVLGLPVIVLDHHEAEEESKFAIVVNTQLSPEYSNKQLSGVGVVYKFLQALDDEFGLNDADEYLDCVTLGNVADVMDLTSPETRYYVYKGLTQIKNGYLKELIFKNIGAYSKMNPHTLAFNAIPKMNAIIRVGTLEEKKELFEALIGREKPFYNTRTKKEETLQYKLTRIGTNLHKKQGDTKKKWVAKFKEEIAEQGLDKNKIITVLIPKEAKFEKELTGVIASSLTSFYRKPVLLLHHNEKEKYYSGSMRGFNKALEDTKSFLLELELFDYVQGHAQAGGVKISEENFAKLHKLANERLTFDANESNEYEVDFIVPFKQVNKKLIENIHSYEKHWGKGIEPPLFGIKEVEVEMKNVKLSSGGMIKMTANGIDYTQFVADQRLVKYAETLNKLTLNIVGTLSVNEFLGNTSYQVVIEDFEIVKVEEVKGFKRDIESIVW